MFAIVRFGQVVYVLREPRAFTVDGVNYPASVWYASDADKRRFGCWPVVQDERPTDPTKVVVGSTFEVGQSEVLEHWVTQDLDADEQARRLVEAKVAAKRSVDEQAEQFRLRVVTPGAVQQIIYIRKADEAISLLANYTPENPPPAGKFPLMEAEVGYTGATIFDVATVVKAKSDLWTGLAAQVETIRLSAKAQIDEATTPAQAYACTILSWPSLG